MSDLGSKIWSFRKTAGLSQVELAEQVGVTRNVIANLEVGRSAKVTPDQFTAIARALNVHVAVLVPAFDPERAARITAANIRLAEAQLELMNAIAPDRGADD